MNAEQLKKYYQAAKANKPLFKTSLNQKIKILKNISKFFKFNSNKPLIIKNKPVTAQIEPTSNCNLRCEMCVREKIGVPLGTMKFEKLIENIKNLTRELEKKKRKTIVSFAIVILKENLEEVSEFVKLAKKVGVKKIIFQTIQNKEDYVKNYDKKTKQQTVVKFIEKVKVKVEKAKQLGRKLDVLVVFDEGKAIEGCIWPWRGIYITWNGFITPCCKILDYRKPMIGNILKQDFWEIWNSGNYQMFRKLLRKRMAPLPCRGCSMV